MMAKKICASILLAASLVGLTACATKTAPAQGDIFTQTVLSEDKITITVLVKNAFSIDAFERLAEEKFPRLDIIQVGNFTSDMGIQEYKERLVHDDLTDIVMTWPLEVGEEFWPDRLMDLSSLPMSGKYNTAMLNNISRDGKLYYIPGPSQIRGIVYNKTLFNEKGWKVPTDFDSFVALCKTIEDSGIRSLQLGLGNEEVLYTAFMGYGHASCFNKPDYQQWLAEYNKGRGSVAEHFVPAFDTFQELIDAGILQENDLNIRYAEREQMLFSRRCAMVEDSVLMARMGPTFSSTDEFALMPFFNQGEDGDWARVYPVCYVGVNKHLAEEKNKKKYDMAMQLLEYISTPEGQQALIEDNGAMISALNGVETPNAPEIVDLLPAISHGRYAVFTPLKNSQTALHRGLAGILQGDMTVNEVISMVDKANIAPPAQKLDDALGVASKDFSILETGNFITDIMRIKTGCDIALFLDNGKDGTSNGKGVSARLYKGDVYSTDIKRILPDFRRGEKLEIWKVTMTGENLLKTLEYSIPVDNYKDGWFYYFSGLRMEYAPSAAPGERIKKITDSNGNEIDKTKIYSIAVMDESVPQEYMISCDKTGIIIPELLETTILQTENISPSEDGRFKVGEP